jgi:hypothetical protein
VPENPLDHGLLLDAGDHPELPATTSASLYVNGEHPLEAWRLRLSARCRSVVAASPRSLDFSAAARIFGTTRDRSGLAGANTPWYLVRWGVCP